MTEPQASSTWRWGWRWLPVMEVCLSVDAQAAVTGWRPVVPNRFAERKVTLCPPLPPLCRRPLPSPHLPFFYCEQLDRSAVIGCTSSTWAALPFLAVPNGAANSMLLAGWQTGRWEPANGRLDETQAPVNSVGSLRLLLLRPASCHLRFGLINPLRADNHSCPSLLNYSFISSPFIKPLQASKGSFKSFTI